MPENIDEDDHDENQEIFAFDENMHENGHDENQENEANQNVLNEQCNDCGRQCRQTYTQELQLF